MTFGSAMDPLRNGKRVTRGSWGGAIMNRSLLFIPFAPVEVAASNAIGKAAPDLIGQTITLEPFIGVCEVGLHGTNLAPYTPTQADLLATDWSVYVGKAPLASGAIGGSTSAS